MFSDAFSEGQARDINGEFPSDSDPYIEHYDYLSDSDLEDESSCSEEEYAEAPGNGNPEPPSSPRDSNLQVLSTTPLDHPPQSSTDADEIQNDDRLTPISAGPSNISDNLHSRPGNGLPRMGKVAVIRDMAAVTCVNPSANQCQSSHLPDLL